MKSWEQRWENLQKLFKGVLLSRCHWNYLTAVLAGVWLWESLWSTPFWICMWCIYRGCWQPHLEGETQTNHRTLAATNNGKNGWIIEIMDHEFRWSFSVSKDSQVFWKPRIQWVLWSLGDLGVSLVAVTSRSQPKVRSFLDGCSWHMGHCFISWTLGIWIGDWLIYMYMYLYHIICIYTDPASFGLAPFFTWRKVPKAQRVHSTWFFFPALWTSEFTSPKLIVGYLKIGTFPKRIVSQTPFFRGHVRFGVVGKNKFLPNSFILIFPRSFQPKSRWNNRSLVKLRASCFRSASGIGSKTFGLWPRLGNPGNRVRGGKRWWQQLPVGGAGKWQTHWGIHALGRGLEDFLRGNSWERWPKLKTYFFMQNFCASLIRIWWCRLLRYQLLSVFLLSSCLSASRMMLCCCAAEPANATEVKYGGTEEPKTHPLQRAWKVWCQSRSTGYSWWTKNVGDLAWRGRRCLVVFSMGDITNILICVGAGFSLPRRDEKIWIYRILDSVEATEG